MATRAYGALKKNVAELEKQFLNFAKRPDGKYTRHELTQCRAFITFCHSEIEIYLEALSSSTVTKAEKAWNSKGSITKAIAAMVAYRGKRDLSLPDDPIDQGKSKRFASILNSAIASQKAAITNNHGIKRKNLVELFTPLGMMPADFEEALLIQLDTLGQRRGDHVHQGAKVSLPKIRDPFDDEKKDIDFLLNDLKNFDELAAKLR